MLDALEDRCVPALHLNPRGMTVHDSVTNMNWLGNADRSAHPGVMGKGSSAGEPDVPIGKPGLVPGGMGRTRQGAGSLAGVVQSRVTAP
jgi:hypothetical protein